MIKLQFVFFCGFLAWLPSISMFILCYGKGRFILFFFSHTIPLHLCAQSVYHTCSWLLTCFKTRPGENIYKADI